MPDFWPWGIAATCFGVAVAAILKTVEANSLLRDEQKKSARLEVENAALMAEVDKCKQSATDTGPEPIKYPKSSRVA
jgi:hypothetical protein